MTSKIISSIQLTTEQTQTHAPAVAEVAMSIAGRARALWERAHGASAVPGEIAADRRNPQGTVGADHSGPPFGAALLLPVASLEWGSTPTGVVWPHPGDRRTVGNPRTSVSWSGWRVWNRPHAQRPDGLAPLQQLGVLVRYTISIGSTSSSFRIRVRNETTESQRAMVVSANANVTAETSTGVGDENKILFSPGTNEITVTASRESGDRDLWLHSVTLVVVAKRRHGLTFPG